MSTSNRFDQAAATWDELPRRVELARAVADGIEGQVVLSHDLDVLDFGCGSGLLTLALQPLVRTVVGTDTSGGMLEVLNRKVLERGLTNVTTVLLSPGKPLLSGTRFHLIVSSMTLHHVANIPPLLAHFHDQLQTRGRIALADLDLEDGSFHEDGRDVFHLGFERGAFQALLAKSGFVELNASTVHVVQKGGRDYPIFLVTGSKQD